MSGVCNTNTAIEVITLTLPAARTTTNTSTTVLDTSKYQRGYFLVIAGTTTDGTATFSITSSATSGGSYAADDALLDTGPAITSAADDQVYKVDLDINRLDNRFVKAVLTVTGSPSTGGINAVVFVGELKKW